MTTPPLLTGSHLRTYLTIFQHPISHNLEWREVHALMGEIGQVTDEPNGNLKVTRNGEILVLHPQHKKDVSEMDDIMMLRHFIQRSEAKAQETDERNSHWLLVIDHHEARIFRSEMRGSAPEKIMPHEPDDYFRHAQDSKEVSRGKEKPDPNSYFEPVAEALSGGGQILIFGSGTGTSSEMEQFIAWAKERHPELSQRIVGSQVVDARHLTEGQLLAKARAFYATVGNPMPGAA